MRPLFLEENEQKRFANTKPTKQQQSILLPSPLGEGLGVRPVVGRLPVAVRPFFIEEYEQNALQTQSQQRNNKAYYYPLPLERGWG